MNLPMVLMGVSQLSKTLGGVGLSNGLKHLKLIRELDQAAVTGAEREAALAASIQATGVKATTAGAAIKAMIVSMGPLLAVTAIIGGLAAA